MKVVLVRFRDEQRKDFPLEGATTILGRRPDCGLRIQTNDVSRQHCEIRVDQEVHVKDLGSSNGTYVNGKRVAETTLNAGDRLGVGPVMFVVQIDGKPKTIEPLDTDSELAIAASDEDDDVLDLNDDDFDLDDPISALEALEDDADEDEDV